MFVSGSFYKNVDIKNAFNSTKTLRIYFFVILTTDASIKSSSEMFPTLCN